MNALYQELGLSRASIQFINIFINATLDTIYMLVGALIPTLIIGLPIGIILFLISPNQLYAKPLLYKILSLLINLLRAPPFLILIILLIPFTKFLVGKSIGVLGIIPPLVIGCVPLFARLVETSLREVNKGVIEATISMGVPLITLVRVLLMEARMGIIAAITALTIILLSYTSLAGVVGGGGLGDLVLRYGYQRRIEEYMWPIIILLVLTVQVIQMLGDYFVMRYSKSYK